MNTQKFGAITSSTNSEEIATRVKGIILGLSSVIILLAARFFHITLTANDIIALASELGSVAGAITLLYGAGMWVMATIFKTPSINETVTPVVSVDPAIVTPPPAQTV